MGNRKTREVMLEKQDAEDWNQVRKAERAATSDVHARGIGLRRIQLIVIPSFQVGRAWEVRQRENDWFLFKSGVVSQLPAIQLVGYDDVQIDGKLLMSYFSRIVGLSVPISPIVEQSGGADGTLTQLAVFGGFTEFRLQWWSDSPAEWGPIVKIAVEMNATFTSAEQFN